MKFFYPQIKPKVGTSRGEKNNFHWQNIKWGVPKLKHFFHEQHLKWGDRKVKKKFHGQNLKWGHPEVKFFFPWTKPKWGHLEMKKKIPWTSPKVQSCHIPEERDLFGPVYYTFIKFNISVHKTFVGKLWDDTMRDEWWGRVDGKWTSPKVGTSQGD